MKLKTGYYELTAAQALELANIVAVNMTGKAIWAALAALLAQLATEAVALSNAMSASGLGASDALVAATRTVATSLSRIADGANNTAAVTEAQLSSTGLPQGKQRAALTHAPNSPQDLQLRHGQMPGAVDGKVKADPEGNIRGYEGQWALDPNGPWSDIETFPNSRSFHWTGLQRGKDTWFRVRARNTVGAGPWSDPATIMVN